MRVAIGHARLPSRGDQAVGVRRGSISCTRLAFFQWSFKDPVLENIAVATATRAGQYWCSRQEHMSRCGSKGGRQAGPFTGMACVTLRFWANWRPILGGKGQKSVPKALLELDGGEICFRHSISHETSGNTGNWRPAVGLSPDFPGLLYSLRRVASARPTIGLDPVFAALS